MGLFDKELDLEVVHCGPHFMYMIQCIFVALIESESEKKIRSQRVVV